MSPESYAKNPFPPHLPSRPRRHDPRGTAPLLTRQALRRLVAEMVD